MYLVEKKPTRVDRLQYKIIITKYLNIGSFSIKHEHVHKVVVKNGSCITSHNNLNTRGEQAFYTKYTGK